jgi:chromosome partitioning protein
VAVANLKGGVGKSTLTANLGAALCHHSARPRKVLLVDLDYQGSLTKLCLRHEDRQEILLQDRFVHRLFLDDNPGPSFALRSRTPIQKGQDNGFILPANEKLAEVEELVKSQALLGRRREDARQILRQALHGEVVDNNYDLVLLDCPPRLTTACINALACCDLVLIPVLLDDTSAESPPRLLTLLSEMRDTVFPEFPRVAVVANKRAEKSRLLLREAAVWDALQHKPVPSWTRPIHYCTAMIRSFTEEAWKKTFPALHLDFRPAFEAVLDELWQLLFPPQPGGPAAAVRKAVQPATGGVR